MTSIAMEFQDYMAGDAFSRNDRQEMRARLSAEVKGEAFDLVFTQSRGEHGVYWARHANHVRSTGAGS